MDQGFAIGLGVKLIVTCTFCKPYLTEALSLWLMRHYKKKGEEVFDATRPRAVCFIQWSLVSIGVGQLFPRRALPDTAGCSASLTWRHWLLVTSSIVSAPNCCTHSFSDVLGRAGTALCSEVTGGYTPFLWFHLSFIIVIILREQCDIFIPVLFMLTHPKVHIFHTLCP